MDFLLLSMLKILLLTVAIAHGTTIVAKICYGKPIAATQMYIFAGSTAAFVMLVIS